jgi:hypothetical protein
MRDSHTSGTERITRRRRCLKRLEGAACLAALALAVGASPAAASITIGQTSADSEVCEGPLDVLQPTVTAGNAYVVPAVGTITSWSHRAGPSDDDQPTKMKVFRKVAEPSTYQVVAQDGPRMLNPGVLNTFTTNLAVMPGDVLGMTVLGMSAGNPTSCHFDAPGETSLSRFGDDLPGGVAGAFTTVSDLRVNISAVVAPSNAFALGEVRRNKKKGTATLTVNVPNPGKAVLSGKGVKTAGAAGPLAAKTVPAAGEVKLKVRAKGEKKRKLNKTGKVKIKAKIIYTPTGGSSRTKTKKVKLKKRG